MKQFILIGLLTLFSCEKNTTEYKNANLIDLSTVNYERNKGDDFSSYRKYSEKLLKKLSANDAWVTHRNLAKIVDGGAHLSDLEKIKFPKKALTINNYKFELKLELINRDAYFIYDNFKNRSEYTMLIDMDLFKNKENGNYVAFKKGKKKNFSRSNINTNDFLEDLKSEKNPIFSITISQIVDEDKIEAYRLSDQKTRRSKNASDPKYYIFVREIRLDHKEDSGAEEFEIYLKYGDNSVKQNTSHLFNGNSRFDKAGKWEKYMNVNYKKAYRTYSGPGIALAQVDDYDEVGFVAIDNDFVEGQHDYDGNSNDKRTTTYFRNIDATVLTKKLPYNTEKELFAPTYDDLYKESGVMNITRLNAIDRLSGRINYKTEETTSVKKLEHVNYTLGMEKWPRDTPDPEPLSVTVNGSSYLRYKQWGSWSASITNADSYKWYVKMATSNSWTQLSSTTEQSTYQMFQTDFEVKLVVIKGDEEAFDIKQVTYEDEV